MKKGRVKEKKCECECENGKDEYKNIYMEKSTKNKTIEKKTNEN